MPKRFLIIANLKQNPLPHYHFSSPESLEVALAPQTSDILNIPPNFIKAAQNTNNDASQLSLWGVKYCLVGHSYYRNHFGENNEIVQRKIDQLLAVNITPIICARNFSEIPLEKPFLISRCLIMFEPEEAISTNGQYHPLTPNQINNQLSGWDKKLPSTRFLYGGSVNRHFPFSELNLKLCSGVVVGHASLNPDEFWHIIKQCANLKIPHS